MLRSAHAQAPARSTRPRVQGIWGACQRGSHSSARTAHCIILCICAHSSHNGVCTDEPLVGARAAVVPSTSSGTQSIMWRCAIRAVQCLQSNMRFPKRRYCASPRVHARRFSTRCTAQGHSTRTRAKSTVDSPERLAMHSVFSLVRAIVAVGGTSHSAAMRSQLCARGYRVGN